MALSLFGWPLTPPTNMAEPPPPAVPWSSAEAQIRQHRAGYCQSWKLIDEGPQDLGKTDHHPSATPAPFAPLGWSSLLCLVHLADEGRVWIAGPTSCLIGLPWVRCPFSLSNQLQAGEWSQGANTVSGPIPGVSCESQAALWREGLAGTGPQGALYSGVLRGHQELGDELGWRGGHRVFTVPG
jgi:hypothetical protein